MKYQDFCRQIELREDKSNYKNNVIAEKVLSEYLDKIEKSDISYRITGNFIEDLIYNYFLIKGTKNEKEFNEILNSYNFNYSMSIHNAIYYLLATDREYVPNSNPLLWPGIIEINKFGPKYVLSTVLGKIEVYKASEFLANSASYHIFNKQLMGKCYERTYDFLRENRDYQVVLSYMPDFFYGGNYHAYLEKNGQVLDIASNAIYLSKESIDKIFCGETIKKISWKQVQKKFNSIKNTNPEINYRQKLLTLTLYYDIKNNQKK